MEILDEIRSVARRVGWVPSSTDFEDHSDISMAAVRQHFDSWTAARKAAGVSEFSNEEIEELLITNDHAPKEALSEDVRQLRERLGDTMTSADVVEFGEYPPEDYEAVFGSIQRALDEAGIVSA